MKLFKSLLVGLALVTIAGVSSKAEASYGSRDAVYVLSNDADSNEVLRYLRSHDGTLTFAGAYDTAGTGSGGGLGSQGAIALSSDGRWLFAVSAGSDEIAMFWVTSYGLWLYDTIDSGGEMPTSLAYRYGRLYVLNAGGTGNITGFYVGYKGLTAIPGSTQPLSDPAAAGAQVGFNPANGDLIVTERATNRVLVYPVDYFGRAQAPTINDSAGMTPFGFAFATQYDYYGYVDHLLVSEAAGGAAGASTISSYDAGDATLDVITGAAPTNQSAACWVITTPDGRYAYTTNTASNTITGFAVAADGSLSILDADGVTAETAAGPIDGATSRSGRYLYVLDGGADAIDVFRVGDDGSLTAIQRVDGLPASSVGMAAF